MNENKIEQYNSAMSFHLPSAVSSATWWWNVVTGFNRNALITEYELHNAIEYAKNFYKKQFELDEELDELTKERFKQTCDADLSYAEWHIKEYELEPVSNSKYKYKCANNPPQHIPYWVSYVIQHYLHPKQ